jgi:hypothetical protein
MHPEWPADTALDWLRLELDRPVDDAVFGWTAPPPILPLAFDSTRPAEALPTGIVEKRMAHQPNWIVMLVGFGVGLAVWFKMIALMPLISGMTPVGRWILSALPLLTLPWWMDAFPQAISYFNREGASVIRDVFADLDKTDRLVATDAEQATLANGERIVWRLGDSVYHDTLGTFRFAPPNPSLASEQAARTALAETIATQTRALDDAKRAELFSNLLRDKRNGLMRAGEVFVPAAKDAAADPSASSETRRAATRFLQ